MAENTDKTMRPRLPRKRMFAAAGAMVLCLTATAAATYFAGGVAGLFGEHAEEAGGVDCTLIDSVRFDHGSHERWVRQYIAVGSSDGMARVRTGLRVARAAAEGDRADLVLVVVADRHGPKARPLIRDSAIGARIVYAPNPARIAGMTRSYTVRYRTGAASASGAFYGDAVDLPLERIEPLAAAITEPTGCAAPAAEETAEAAHHGASKPSHH